MQGVCLENLSCTRN